MPTTNNNIKTILFDLDDTLINTRAVFSEVIDRVKREAAAFIDADYDTFSKTFDEKLNRAVSEVHLDPVDFWPLSLNYLQSAYNFDDSYKAKLYADLQEIYTILPTLKDDVVKTLDYLSQNYQLGVVTHAETNWVYFKLDGHGIRHYFSHIEIADPKRPKDPADWQKAVSALNAQPMNCAVVGDNIKGDMQSGFKIGAGKLFWINDKESWDFYRQGELPENTIEISGVNKLIEIL